MLNKFRTLSFLLLIILTNTVIGQHYVNSPYTRYGIGDLLNTGFAYNKSLGGVTTGIRPKNQLNYLNPASFTSQDTNSFLLQSGLSVRMKTLNADETKEIRNNSNIEYFIIGFPIGKFLSSSIGLVPYSRVEYSFFQDGLPDDDYVLNQEYQGRGGYNEFYFGLSGEILKTVSVGASINYLFGSLDRQRKTFVDEVSKATAVVNFEESYVASDFFFRAGIQVHPVISEKHSPVLGIAFENKATIDSKADVTYIHDYNYIDFNNTAFLNSINDKNDSSFTFNLPQKISIGGSYTYDNRITIAADYINQKWSEEQNLKDYNSIRGGIAYRHKALGSRTRSPYIQNIEFRLGGHYTNTYLNLSGNDINDIGASFGIGLPWKNFRGVFTGTAINISYEYGTVGVNSNNLIKENYHNIMLGLVLHDFWFFKSKYD